ncbi:MAG: tyrosine-type recombinase/integrase [Acidobacteriota bacterium]
MVKPESRKKRAPKRVLALPDLEHAKTAVLNSLTSSSAQRTNDHAIREFVSWYCSEPRLAFNRTVVLRYRIHLEQRGFAPATINLRLAAVRRIASEAADAGLLSQEPAAGIRCAELLALQIESIQQREEHWVIADLVGKGGHVRTVPIPTWVKNHVDVWTAAAGVTHGPVFRAIKKAGRVWGDGMSPKMLWDVVRAAAARAGIEKLAPHDLRRTCARLCHLAGEGLGHSIGLGLFIARAIVSAHGGEIDVASSADAGTTITVRLPKSLA